VEPFRSVPDELSRERLIAAHLPLVRSIARRHVGRGEELDDLVQVGAVGLVKASDRFDAKRGVAFGAFAAPAIEGEIRNHLRDRTPPVRIPREQERIRRELRHRRDELASTLGRAPTVQELAEALSVDEDEVERALSTERARDAVSVSSEVDTTDLPADSQALTISDDRLVLASSLRSLDERERRIVFLRFHADMTERQIAAKLGISQAHVSRLLSAALAKLRKELGSSGVNAKDGDIIPDTAGSGGNGVGTKISNVGEPDNPELPASGQETVESRGHSYSGRFLVRMPKSLHEQLARAAEQEQVSLNRFVIDVLTGAVAKGELAKPGELAQPPVPVQQPHELSDRQAGLQRIPGPSFRLALAANLIVVVLAGVIAVVLLVLALQRGI
jgi:RNA polymerase sigma-B factor